MIFYAQNAEFSQFFSSLATLAIYLSIILIEIWTKHAKNKLNGSVFFCYTKQEINMALKNYKQKINILSSPKFKKSYVLIVLSSQTMFVFVMN